MNSNMFIKVDTLDADGNVHIKYVNKNQILTIHQDYQNIVIEMSDHTKLRIPNQHIQIFMDRFR
jgi:hypothetical protein